MMLPRDILQSIRTFCLFLLYQCHVSAMPVKFGTASQCTTGTAGYKADPSTGCETYYYCHADGLKEAFSCPLGMIFDERRGQCDQWNSVTCPGAFPEPLFPSQGFNQPSFPQQQQVNQPYQNVAGGAATTNPMDFLAALLFPPVAGQQDINDFMNTAPSGVRNSFMRVAGEGQVPSAYMPQQPFPPNQYVEPLTNTRPYAVEPGPNLEGSTRNREGPGSNALGSRRSQRPSPAMNPLDTQLQGGPPSFDSGPVPPHLMGGHSYMFGQLSMHNQTAPASPPQQQMMNMNMGVNGMNMQLGSFGMPTNPAMETLRPLWRSLMQNPFQPQLRRMAALIAAGGTGNAMDAGLISGKQITDPMGTAAAADPALAGAAGAGAAAGGKSNKKILDDGLVDARR